MPCLPSHSSTTIAAYPSDLKHIHSPDNFYLQMVNLVDRLTELEWPAESGEYKIQVPAWDQMDEDTSQAVLAHMGQADHWGSEAGTQTGCWH